MPRNGSGIYSLPSGNPVVTGTTISSTLANNTLSDIATALTASLSADGQTALTGNLNAGNNKITSLAAGTQAGDSLRWQQLFSQGVPLDIASGATVDIGAQNTSFLRVTGTTTITSFGSNYNGPRYLTFQSSLVLTYNATSLVLPGAVNLTVNAGDIAVFIPKATSSGVADGWELAAYLSGASATGTAITQPANDNSTKIATTAYVDRAAEYEVKTFTATVASNVLTVSYPGGNLFFRSPTLNNGTATPTFVPASNMSAPVGSTFGIPSGVLGTIVVAIAYNGGSPVMCMGNSAGVTFSEDGLISPTTISSGATSSTVIYSASAVSPNSPYRVLGYFDITEATAGTWATAPSFTQPTGGEVSIGRKLYQLGKAPVYGARAWAVFDGTVAGTNAPTAGGNVTSITRTGTGTYTANLTTAMPDTNYAPVISVSGGANIGVITGRTTTTFSFQTENSTSGANTDIATISFSIFR